MIPEQRDDVCGTCPLKVENQIDTLGGIRPPVDIVAEKDHCIAWVHLRSDQLEYPLESGEVPVNVADRECRHIVVALAPTAWSCGRIPRRSWQARPAARCH